MKLLRVGGADVTVSIGAVILFAFENPITSCESTRVSCVAAPGCNEAGKLMFASAKLPVAASAATPNATPPKTIRRIKGKPGRCMILSLEGCISTSLYLICSTGFKQNSYDFFGLCFSPQWTQGSLRK
jgi:hypothetical protein